MSQVAYLYPGQGTQRQGMLLDASEHDLLAEIWARADRHSQTEYGFSIRQVVAENPQTLQVAGAQLTHPAGILHRTEFSQVALAVVAYAQTELLRAAGKLDADAWFAGHSLGEFTALTCYGQLLSLEALIDVVYLRGQVMNDLVERDESGASDYGMLVLRPDRLGLDDAQVVDYVESVAASSGHFLQVVNHNLAGGQYAVAGTLAGLAALEVDAKARAERVGQRRPSLRLPGVDVPFHSKVLAPGVVDFRRSLQRIIPAGVPEQRLVGRFIPNLVGAPFSLDSAFLRQVQATAPDVDLPAQPTARELLIELLAWQFASPVQWIKTQDALLAADIDCFVEIGLAESPVLTNLLTATLAQSRHQGRNAAVLNLQRDQARIFD